MDSRIIGELEWDSRSNNDFVEILYGDKEELEEKLIGSYIIGVSKNVIELSNEVKVKASSISSDGDASARANILEYKANKSLIITSINLGTKEENDFIYTRIVTFYNNNTEIAKIEFIADKGSGNVYSSVSGFTINTRGYAIVAS